MNQLDVAIENLYEAFSEVSAPTVIDGCSHCIDDKNIDKLLGTNLRSISADDLASYASSAFLTVGDVSDYLYFLPRILEISIRDTGWWPSIEVTGRALSSTDIARWPEGDRRALIEFFVAAINYFIDDREFEYIDDWICGIARSGVDIRPFLTILEDSSDAVFHYVNINAMSLEKGKLSNSFWEPSDNGHDEIVEWLQSEKVRRIYAEQQNGPTSET